LANGDRFSLQQDRKWTKKWNLRKVVMQLEKDQINALIDAQPGTSHYLLNYPTACTKVVEELDTQTRKEYVALAKQWNDSGPERHIQIKYISYLLIMKAYAHQNVAQTS
jgi:hypothetical protein